MKTEKFEDLFDFAKKSKIKAGEGRLTGSYPFYTSSPKLSKRVDKWQIEEQALIFGTGGKPSVHFADERFSTSTDCLVATKRKDSLLNIKFVYYYLFGNIHILERGFKGAGLKHISKKYIQKIDIPIYDIETQNKIVHLLDQASQLLQKREDSLQLLDELLRAQFLEMFGDPVANPFGYKRKFLKDFYINNKDGTKCGPFGSALKKGEYTNSGIPVWNMDNITKNSEFNPKPNLFVTDKKAESLEAYKTIDKDIIVSRAGTVGKMAIVKTNYSKSLISTNLIRIRLNKNLLPEYFIALMKYAGKGVGRLKKGSDGAFTHMNTKVLDSLEFPVPPLNKQNIFLLIQNRFDKTKTRQRSALHKLQTLYNALLQKAFKGELTFTEEVALNTLLEAIDIEAEQHDLEGMSEDNLKQLVKKLNEEDFEDVGLRNQAKQAAFQLLQEGKLKLVYEQDSQQIKLDLA